MIFNMLGGAGLNFKVVGGTAQPENQTENTIWINTDVEITGWVIGEEDPSGPVAGMVSIRSAAPSSVAFNALKKNGITVYPLSVKQFVDGVWTIKTAQIYQDGEWKSLTVYFYKSGDEYTEITGGFSKSKSSGQGTESLTKGSDSLYLNCVGPSASGANFTVASVNKIDVTSFDTLYVKIKHTTTSAKKTRFLFALGESRAMYAYDASVVVSKAESFEGTLSLDVSDVTGEFYLLMTMNGQVVANNGNCYVYEVYGE